ncbi:hypothetical protein BDV35DRAFT_370910 [Aspergillus flavus]|uniref:Uncharacterized protein n=1 Tax=Aspergillus flavus TaxID=5059 RepID=A0A5N6GJ61_ASPFL|nr:hypothetical protein BDV35DRAFT_370910 [Aspergillus flavus]
MNSTFRSDNVQLRIISGLHTANICASPPPPPTATMIEDATEEIYLATIRNS